MTRSYFIPKLVAPIAAGLFATAAFAHPSLVSSTPADKSQVSAPATIELKFSETLVPQFSAASLVMTGMPGMANHGPMKINARVTGAADGKNHGHHPRTGAPAGRLSRRMACGFLGYASDHGQCHLQGELSTWQGTG